MNAGFGIGAAAGGGSATGVPGVPGGGSSGTGPGGALGGGGGRAAGLLDTLGTGTGIGGTGQSGGGQSQGGGSGTITTPGSGTGGTGSGSGGAGTGGVGSGSGGVGGAGSGDNTASGPSTGGYVTYTDDGGFNLTSADGKGGTVTVHFEPNKDADGNNVGGYYGITRNGETLTTESKPPEGAINSAEGTDSETGEKTTDLVTDQGGSTTSSGSTGSSTGSSGSTTSSGSTGSGTSSSGSTTSTGGTQGTGEQGQSGAYNPDDDRTYRRGKHMTAEERTKAMEDSQKLKPVDGGRGGEGGSQRRTGLKVSDVKPFEFMKSKTDPYSTPNPDADQSEHSGPIPVSDPQGDVEHPLPDGNTTAPGFGAAAGATRPGSGSTPGGFDPRAADQPNQ